MAKKTKAQPLTEAEQSQLNDLQYRRAMAQWQEGEEAREAELAALEPVKTALGDVERTIADLETSADALDGQNEQRVRRIVQILRYDARGLLARHEALSVGAPEPQAPGTGA